MHGQRPCRLDAGCCGANWPCLNQQAQPDTLTLPLPGGWHDCQWLQCTPSGAAVIGRHHQVPLTLFQVAHQLIGLSSTTLQTQAIPESQCASDDAQ